LHFSATSFALLAATWSVAPVFAGLLFLIWGNETFLPILAFFAFDFTFFAIAGTFKGASLMVPAIHASDRTMLDNPEKTARLLAALKAAAPFDVKLGPELMNYLRAENLAEANGMSHTVFDLSYAGDEGGIMCHMSPSDETGRALVVSLTHVHVPRSMPLARVVADYQKHRLKKLKKQHDN
jgi:hypothetical protein